MDFKHVSVLLEESVAAVITDKKGIYVDCTLGGAGHFMAIGQQLDPEATIIGIDQDLAAIKNAEIITKNLQCQVHLVQENFSNLAEILSDLKIEAITGIIFDLGVSSYQLDTPERGFSYMHDAPLDMRMSKDNPKDAAFIVNKYSQEQLAEVIYKYGEERWSKRIAEFIIKARLVQPIKTTHELVSVIKQAIPKGARQDGPHPAKRTFQALRIEVNNELGILEKTFKVAVKYLKPAGKIAVITFHSLEDRITKQVFAELQRGCICPKNFPMCMCDIKPQLKKSLSLKSSKNEVEENHRSRSARLRVAEKI